MAVKIYLCMHSRLRSVLLATALLTLSLVVMSASPIQQRGAADAVGGATITAPAPPSFSLSTPNQDPGNFVLSGFGATDTLNVSVGFVNPPAGTTFALPTNTNLTPGYGYNFSGEKTQISFTGTMANANAALADMTVSTGSTNGTITIRVTASVNTANVYYNPINGHYYKFDSTSRTASAATAFAESDVLYGVKGYLATVTSSQEQSFIHTNISGNNLWLGGTDDFSVINSRCPTAYATQSAAEGRWTWYTGPEACQEFQIGNSSSFYWVHKDTGAQLDRTSGNQPNARYTNFCSGEPNNWSGAEHFMVDKWSGSTCWNDWGTYSNAGQTQGSIIEFSENWGTGANARGSFTGAGVASAEVSALVDNSPKDLVLSRSGSGAISVSWTAPSTGTVTTYTVTSTPGGKTCTIAAPTTTCVVSGLTNGTSYTFITTATFSDNSTKSSLASAALIADDGLAPVATAPTNSFKSSANATVKSSKTGVLYLVNTSVTVTNEASITGAAGNLWNQVTINTAGANTSLALTGLDEGTYKAYAKDALGVLSAASTGTVTVDDTSPTVTLSVTSAASNTAAISYKVTGNEGIDCATLSTTNGVDFDLTNISSITGISQTSSSICTVNALSVATEGGGAVISTLTKASSFSIADDAGNTQTTLGGSPKSITVTIPRIEVPTPTTTTTTAPSTGSSSGSTPNSNTGFVAATTTTLPVGQKSVQTITSTVPSGLSATTTTVPVATTTTLAPVQAQQTADQPGQPPTAPTAEPGQVTALVGGVPTEVVVERQNNGVIVKLGPVSLIVKAFDGEDGTVPLDANGAIKVSESRKIRVDAQGLADNSPIEAWVYSDPIALGSAKADASGAVNASFNAPEELEAGKHRLILKGIAETGDNLVVSLGLEVASTSSGPNWSWVFVLLLLAAIGTGLVLPARRRARNGTLIQK